VVTEFHIASTRFAEHRLAPERGTPASKLTGVSATTVETFEKTC
jgi:hypothetical protein